MFRKLDLFLSSVEGNTAALLAPLGRGNLNHCPTVSELFLLTMILHSKHRTIGVRSTVQLHEEQSEQTLAPKFSFQYSVH
jgi:hypothetical protein